MRPMAWPARRRMIRATVKSAISETTTTAARTPKRMPPSCWVVHEIACEIRFLMPAVRFSSKRTDVRYAR